MKKYVMAFTVLVSQCLFAQENVNYVRVNLPPSSTAPAAYEPKFCVYVIRKVSDPFPYGKFAFDQSDSTEIRRCAPYGQKVDMSDLKGDYEIFVRSAGVIRHLVKIEGQSLELNSFEIHLSKKYSKDYAWVWLFENLDRDTGKDKWGLYTLLSKYGQPVFSSVCSEATDSMVIEDCHKIQAGDLSGFYKYFIPNEEFGTYDLIFGGAQIFSGIEVVASRAIKPGESFYIMESDVYVNLTYVPSTEGRGQSFDRFNVPLDRDLVFLAPPWN